MSTWAIVTHYIVIAGVLLYIHKRIRRLGRVTLLHFSSFYYILTTMLFLPMLQGNDFAHLTDTLWARAFLAGAIFSTGCILADRLFYHPRAESRQLVYQPTLLALIVYFGLFIFGVTGFIRYFFLGGAYHHFGEVLHLMGSGVQYYDARGVVSDAMGSEPGRGVAHATGSVASVFPVVIALSYTLYYKHKEVVYLAVIAASVILSLLISSINLERAPMLYSIGIPVLMLVLHNREGTVEKRVIDWMKWRWLAIFGSLITFCSALVYTFTDKIGLIDAVTTAFDRIFVVPGMTSLFYFNAFPDAFPFRGMSHIFYLGSVASQSDVSTREIALYATRIYSMNANSGFLATAYTGGGMAGVTLLVILYLVIVVAIDKAYERQSGYARCINLLVNACGIAAIAELPMSIALTVGGFALPSVFFYGYLCCCRRKRTDFVQARSTKELVANHGLDSGCLEAQ